MEIKALQNGKKARKHDFVSCKTAKKRVRAILLATK
jgi:hypothetical protein